MLQNSKVLYALSFCITAAGFLLPLWPLCVLGIVLAALSGRWMFAILSGLLLDVAWGAPHGTWHVLYVPFTLVALGAALLRYFLAGYFLDRTGSDTL